VRVKKIPLLDRSRSKHLYSLSQTESRNCGVSAKTRKEIGDFLLPAW
jgi:hypothetical protein